MNSSTHCSNCFGNHLFLQRLSPLPSSLICISMLIPLDGIIKTDGESIRVAVSGSHLHCFIGNSQEIHLLRYTLTRSLCPLQARQPSRSLELDDIVIVGREMPIVRCQFLVDPRKRGRWVLQRRLIDIGRRHVAVMIKWKITRTRRDILAVATDAERSAYQCHTRIDASILLRWFHCEPRCKREIGVSYVLCMLAGSSASKTQMRGVRKKLQYGSSCTSPVLPESWSRSEHKVASKLHG